MDGWQILMLILQLGASNESICHFQHMLIVFQVDHARHDTWEFLSWEVPFWYMTFRGLYFYSLNPLTYMMSCLLCMWKQFFGILIVNKPQLRWYEGREICFLHWHNMRILTIINVYNQTKIFHFLCSMLPLLPSQSDIFLLLLLQHIKYGPVRTFNESCSRIWTRVRT